MLEFILALLVVALFVGPCEWAETGRTYEREYKK